MQNSGSWLVAGILQCTKFLFIGNLAPTTTSLWESKKVNEKKTHLKLWVQTKKRQSIKWSFIALLQDMLYNLTTRILHADKFLFIYNPIQTTTSLWESKKKSKKKKQNSFKIFDSTQKRQPTTMKKICITARYDCIIWLQEYYMQTNFFFYTTQHKPQHHYENPKQKAKKKKTHLKFLIQAKNGNQQQWQK